MVSPPHAKEVTMAMSKNSFQEKITKKELKKFKFREIVDSNKKRMSGLGWTDANLEEKKKYGNKKYMSTNMTLMKKEV